MPININEVICNPGSERGILSIVIRNRDKIVDCEGLNLFAEQFSVKANQYIYSVLCLLSSNLAIVTIDSLLVYNTITDIPARQEIDNIGGMQYIDSLINSRIADNLTIYVKQVQACAIKRLAYNMGADIQEYILNCPDDETSEVVLDTIQRRVLDLVLNNQEHNEMYRFGDDTARRLQERMSHPHLIPGYTLGWARYDRITQGFKGNELTVYVAESKTGKSALLLNHAHKFSIVGNLPGLYIDTEMTDEEQEDRELSIMTGIPYEEIFNGMCGEDTEFGTAVDKRLKLSLAVVKLHESAMFHIYLPNFTIEKVTALVRKYQIQHNIAYVIFDYIKLPTSEIGGLASAQEYQRLGFITTCLKDLAGMCAIPVITAAQSNRTQLGSTNQDASSIGGSYRILQIATRLVFLRNKTDYELSQENFLHGNQVLKVSYQRNGSSTGEEVNINFDRPTLRMQEAS